MGICTSQEEENIMAYIKKGYVPRSVSSLSTKSAKLDTKQRNNLDIRKSVNSQSARQNIRQKYTCKCKSSNGHCYSSGGCDDTLKAQSENRLMGMINGGSNYDYDLIVIGGGSGGLAASKVSNLMFGYTLIVTLNLVLMYFEKRKTRNSNVLIKKMNWSSYFCNTCTCK